MEVPFAQCGRPGMVGRPGTRPKRGEFIIEQRKRNTRFALSHEFYKHNPGNVKQFASYAWRSAVADVAPRFASDFERLTASLKRYPDMRLILCGLDVGSRDSVVPAQAVLIQDTPEISKSGGERGKKGR